MTPKFYENHVVTGKLYRPVLHKKGKQWVVVGLSALLLAGLGEAANLQSTHASADTTAQSSRTVQNSATNVYNKLTTLSKTPSNSSKTAQKPAQKMNTNMGVHAFSYPQSASNYTAQVSSSASDVSAKSAGIGADSSQASQFAQSNSGKVTSSDNNLIKQINSDNTSAGTLKSQVDNDLKNASTDSNAVNAENKSVNTYNNKANDLRGQNTAFRQDEEKAQQYSDQESGNVGNLSGLASDASKADVSMKGLFSRDNQDLAQLEAGDAQANQANVTDIIDYQDSDNNIAGSAVFSGQPESTITNDTIKQYAPSGYKLTNSDQTLTFGNSDATQDVEVDSTSNGDIDVHPNEVNVQGHINLNFKNSDGTMTVVPLAYGFQTNDDAGNTNALQHINYPDKVSDPSKFSTNKDVFRLDNGTPLHASDFSFDAKDSGNPYDITVTPSDAQYQNESQHTIYKDMNLYFNAVTSGNNEPSETVKYVDNNGNVVSSDTIKGGAGSNIPMSDSRIKGNTPKGYDINGNNPKSIVMHKGATAIIHVTPTNDTPADITGATEKQANNQTKVINGTDGKNGQNGKDVDGTTPSQLTKGGVVPKGYHVNPNNPVSPVTDKNGHQEMDNNGKPKYTVNVLPNNEHMVVRYYYENNGKQIFVGDDHFMGAYNTSETVNANNDKGLDSGYQLTGQSDTFKFGSDRDDNNIVKVPVKPQSFSNNDTVTFKDINGKTIGTGNVPTDSTPSDADKNIEGQGSKKDKNQVPNGYHIINSDQTIHPDNGNHTVLVAPNAGTPAVMSYKKPGDKNATPIVGKDNKPLNGINGQKVTPSDLDNSGLLPKGYHAKNGATYGHNGKDGNTAQIINIAPNEEHEIVRYYYNQNGKNVFAGDDYFNGVYGQSDDVNAETDKGLDSGYHLVNSDNKFTFNSDNNVKTVSVVPSQPSASDKVQFMDLAGNKINDKNGDPTLDVHKGNPSDVISDATLNNNVPKGYHLVDPNQIVNHDGATHDILIAPNQVQNTITYDEPNGTQVKKNVTGGYNQNGNANDTIPAGYHLANGVNPIFKYGDNNLKPFTVTPNTSADTIIYVDDDNNTNNGNVTGSYTTGGEQAGSKLDTADSVEQNVPAGYQVDKGLQGNNSDLTYDGLSHVIYVKGTKAKQQDVQVKVRAKDANGNFIPSANKTFDIPVNGIIGQGYTINPTDQDVMKNVPNGDAPEASDYSLTGQITPNGLSEKSVTFTYDAPKADSHAIMVYYRDSTGKVLNSGVISDNHVGDKGDITQKVTLPNGYTPVKGADTEYTIQNKPQYINVQVQGKPAKDIFGNNSDKTKISIIYIYRNSEGSTEQMNTKSFNLNSDNIGSTMQIYPADGLEPGYKMDSDDKIISDTLTAQGATPGQVTFVYDAYNKPVKINYQYTDSKGHAHTIGNGQRINGNTNSDITDQLAIPKGYHLTPGERVHVPADNNSSDNENVQVAGDKVVGRAKLYLVYKRGNQMTDAVKYLPISGSIGDSDIVIDPSIYNKVGYHYVGNNTNWNIPFKIDDVVKTDNDNDTFRYDPENTFVYSATPEDVQVIYYDTVGKKQIGPTQDLKDIGYEGQMMDLEGTNSGNLNVDGKDYALRVPTGYHLAYTNNYVTISENDIKDGKEQVDQNHLPIMRLVLGIAEPNFPARKPASSANKPASKANVKPSSAVQPASQGSKASSASVKPSSSANKPASKAVTPASKKANSQSVTPVNPVKPDSSNTKPSSKASANVKPASKANTKPASKASASVVPSASAKSGNSASGNNQSTANSLNDDINKKAQELNSLESAMDNSKVHFANPTSASTSSASSSSATSASAKSASSNSSVAPQSAQPSASDIPVLQPQPKQTKGNNKSASANDNNKSANGNALAPVAQPNAQPEAQEAEPETEPVEEPEAQASDEPAEAESPVSDGDATSNNAEPVASDGVEPTASASTVPASANAGTKLPQTNEGSNFAGVTAIAMLLLSVGLAGADVERKHNE